MSQDPDPHLDLRIRIQNFLQIRLDPQLCIKNPIITNKRGNISTMKYKEGVGMSGLTGHSSLEKVLMQASSRASHTDTRASALPVAKYLQIIVI